MFVTDRACSTYGVDERCLRNLVAKDEGNRPLGKPRRRWEDNTKIYIFKSGMGFMDWIDMQQDTERWRALVNMVIKCWVP